MLNSYRADLVAYHMLRILARISYRVKYIEESEHLDAVSSGHFDTVEEFPNFSM